MKNFIRGMGVGVLVTTMILSIAYMLVGDNISDSEIRERARRLGMVEKEQEIFKKKDTENVSQDAVTKDDAVSKESAKPGSSEEKSDEVTQPPQTEAPAGEQGDASAQQPQETAPEAAQQPQNVPAQEAPADNKVSVTIHKGYDGVKVSRILQNSGVIADAADFNRYLSERGMHMQIRVGTFELERNMDYGAIIEQIIRK